jgi:TonB family protein
VRVAVDASGSVESASLDSPGPSRYFSKVSLQAAQNWKFKPAQADGQNVASAWILHFKFTQAGTDVTPVQVSP